MTTKVIRSPLVLRQRIEKEKKKVKTIGLVPTMGYFHEGHLSLFHQARRENDCVIVSLFVNPTQFSPGEDYKHYPRDFRRDLALAKKEKVDILFVPTSQQMYPDRFSTLVENHQLANVLEGKSRPTHFRGVLTIVAKLFHLIEPDVSYFGQKDYQQALLIHRMAKDLNFNVNIKVLPTIREKDGLAMSSRNVYLKGVQRRQALALFFALQQGRDMILSGMRSSTEILKVMRGEIRKTGGVKINYLEIVDPVTLQKVKQIQKRVLLVGAIWVGRTRLIDNVLV